MVCGGAGEVGSGGVTHTLCSVLASDGLVAMAARCAHHKGWSDESAVADNF